MPNDSNQAVIDEFRANAGRVGGPFAGMRLVLLTTTGARSGRPHTVPVGYLPDEGGRQVFVIGSAGGAPHHPGWFHNLVANPRVVVENGMSTYDADAVVLEPAERDRIFARAVEADPNWHSYEERAGRALPVVALRPVSWPPHPDSAASPGASLRMIHDVFRHELELVRAEIVRAGTTGTRLGAQLRINCLSLCGGLHFHHLGEDRMLFPPIAEQRPELAAVIERLRREHEVIAGLLEQLQSLVGKDDRGDVDPRGLLPEIDRLTGELLAHLDYEEDQLIPVLDAQ